MSVCTLSAKCNTGPARIRKGGMQDTRPDTPANYGTGVHRMHTTSASIVTEVGRLRENVRGSIGMTVDAVDMVTVTYYTGTHTEHAVIVGEHWDAYARAVAALDRQVKRNRLRSVKAGVA